MIIVCTKNGAISIYQRDFKELTINTEYPILEIAGESSDAGFEIGEQIGIIEHSKRISTLYGNG